MSERQPADDWRIVESHYVIETPFLRLRRDRIDLPNGTRIDDYYVRESPGFAVIFALTPADRVVLVRQYKHGIGETVLELPAGAIDPGETPAACARRELAEETGYAGEPVDPAHMATFIADPTHSDSRFHLFFAADARPTGSQELDATEAITIELATLTEVRRFVRDGTICVSPHITAIYYMLDRLDRL